MNKIAIIGCGGSGKTSLSISLSEKLSLPVCHLDTLYWKRDWVSSSHGEFLKAQEEIFISDSWIMDGNYGSTMDARLKQADTIIFLDLPTITCLWGVIKRYFKFRNSNRPDMTKGNKDRLTLEFLKYVSLYRRRKRPDVSKALKNLTNKKIVILTSRKKINFFIHSQKTIKK